MVGQQPERLRNSVGARHFILSKIAANWFVPMQIGKTRAPGPFGLLLALGRVNAEESWRCTKPTGMKPCQPRMKLPTRYFAQHYEASLRVARRILRSREDSEDAVQTAYCAAFRNLHTFRGEASFKTWITRIVVNCCLKQVRKRRARPWVALDDAKHALPSIDSQTVTPERCGPFLKTVKAAYGSEEPTG